LDTSITPGRVKFIQADFFRRDWERGIEQKDEEPKFDLIYDYTVCSYLRALFVGGNGS
jgi:hypothetical protein